VYAVNHYYLFIAIRAQKASISELVIFESRYINIAMIVSNL